MYLPYEIENAKVLITVKAYPLPASKYGELVCTAGVLENGKWIRIYPVPFRLLPKGKQFKKYDWIRLDLKKRDVKKDFRPESYNPTSNAEHIVIQSSLGTKNKWAERKEYVLKEVFVSMKELINLARGEQKKSLGVLKPREIVNFKIKADTREWKSQWRGFYNQFSMFNLDDKGEPLLRKKLRKLPYQYSYEFLSEGDSRPRRYMIEDWEIEALYFNCLKETEGDEIEANNLVRKKYFEEFVEKRDLYLFMGTTYQHHLLNRPNPFVIIGVFYPPKEKDDPRFEFF